MLHLFNFLILGIVHTLPFVCFADQKDPEGIEAIGPYAAFVEESQKDSGKDILGNLDTLIDSPFAQHPRGIINITTSERCRSYSIEGAYEWFIRRGKNDPLTRQAIDSFTREKIIHYYEAYKRYPEALNLTQKIKNTWLKQMISMLRNERELNHELILKIHFLCEFEDFNPFILQSIHTRSEALNTLRREYAYRIFTNQNISKDFFLLRESSSAEASDRIKNYVFSSYSPEKTGGFKHFLASHIFGKCTIQRTGSISSGFENTKFLPSIFSILHQNPIMAFKMLQGFWILPDNIEQLLPS